MLCERLEPGAGADAGAGDRDRLVGCDTWKKVPFYAKHGVDELLIVDVQKRRVDRPGLDPNGEYRAVGEAG